MKILGISAFYHDSAVALIDDGHIVAAAQEERFTRIKHDASFPTRALKYCLAEAGSSADNIDAVAYYEKPLLKFSRILETSMRVAPFGLKPFMAAMPSWLRNKLWIPFQIESALDQSRMQNCPPIYFPEHHFSHAASAYFPSPFESAAVMTLDGVGEWATTTLGAGQGRDLQLFQELRFPHSLGLLYSAFTYFTGFKVNSGEYKLMGLAPYGVPRYVQTILDHLIDLKPDGSFRLNMDYFGYLSGLRMTHSRFSDLFGGPPRNPESDITSRECDLAASIQAVTEEIVLRIARHLHRITDNPRLCMAGGVALNCVSNGKLLREGPFREIWIQPAAGDSGAAIGAALAVWHQLNPNAKRPETRSDAMKGGFLGPRFPSSIIRKFLDSKGYPYHLTTGEDWSRQIASLLAEQKVVGLFQGRMEFGPRALGARSILGDPRSASMQSLLNRKIKFRESFRPFAPACLEETVKQHFEIDAPSPYMLLVCPIRQEHRQATQPLQTGNLIERVNQIRSHLPAVTHVDYSARIQTVCQKTHGRFYDLIKAFEALTGVGVIINTSFNVRGEPIVCTPEDAYRCFMRTDMDVLVLEDCILFKQDQPEWKENRDWRTEFSLD